MKADPISVGKVLSENHRFVGPIYQRTYAWTEKSREMHLVSRRLRD